MLLQDDLCEAFEADLQQYYQTKLKWFWQGKLTLRELCVYMDGLPADSRVGRLGVGGEFRPTLMECLQAAQLNTLKWIDYHSIEHRYKDLPVPDMFNFGRSEY